MSEGFVHSVKVPRLYKSVAKVVQTVQENGGSLKQLIYEQKHTNVQGVYALAFNTIRHGDQLNQLIRKTQILFKEQRLDPWLTRVLITELIWGKQNLKSESKPIQTILSYEKELREEAKNITEDVDSHNPVKVDKPRYVRVNTLMMSVDQATSNFQEEDWQFLSKFDNYSAFLKTVSNLDKYTFVQDFHIPELLIFPQGTAFFQHPGYQSGKLILQDKASCFPAFLLNPPPGSSVLDMCSAPGMKSTHLAAIMQNQGKIFSVERDTRRYKTLCDFVQSTNSTCVETMNKDALTVDSTQCPNVEYILVDPSCSGSGMVDREKVSGKIEKCAPGRLRSLQSFQVLLLRHALLNFPSAKRVVYSTCSVQPEENEHVIDEILSNIGEAYKLVPVKDVLDGNWINFSSLDYTCKDNCLYARPDVDLTNGFFVAVFERNFDVPLPEYKRKMKAKVAGDSSKNVEEKPRQKCEEEGKENFENEIEEKSEERKLSASQKKRMRRRKKMNQRNSEKGEDNKFSGDEIQDNDDKMIHDDKEINDDKEIYSNKEIQGEEKSEEIENISVKAKKKKKKNKHKHSIDENNKNENCPQEPDESISNEKPRKKKKAKVKEPEENYPGNEGKDEKEKSKAKKSKSKDNEISSDVEVSAKSEKKDRKRKESMNVNLEIDAENVLRKKKKKDKEDC